MKTYSVEITAVAENVGFKHRQTTRWPAIEAASEQEALDAAILLHELDATPAPTGCSTFPYNAVINGKNFRLFWFVTFPAEGGNHDYHPARNVRLTLHSGIDRVPSRTA